MLITDIQKIGNNLLGIRKKTGLTQAEVAEKAGISDRTYADIERGSTNMRAETLINICNALNITPDEIFTQKNVEEVLDQEIFLTKLKNCTAHEKATALNLLNVYLDSLGKN